MSFSPGYDIKYFDDEQDFDDDEDEDTKENPLLDGLEAEVDKHLTMARGKKIKVEPAARREKINVKRERSERSGSLLRRDRKDEDAWAREQRDVEESQAAAGSQATGQATDAFQGNDERPQVPKAGLGRLKRTERDRAEIERDEIDVAAAIDAVTRRRIGDTARQDPQPVNHPVPENKRTKTEKKREKREQEAKAAADAVRLAAGNTPSQAFVQADDSVAAPSAANETARAHDEKKKTTAQRKKEREAMLPASAGDSATGLAPSQASVLIDPYNTAPADNRVEDGIIDGEQEVENARQSLSVERGQGKTVIRLDSDPMEVDAFDGVPIDWNNPPGSPNDRLQKDVSQDKEKRKRAISDTGSLLSRVSETEAAEMNVVQDEASQLSKRDKKNKKRNSQVIDLVDDTEDDPATRRAALNQAKERQGKTVSKKRQRREAQQSQQSTQAEKPFDSDYDATPPPEKKRKRKHNNEPPTQSTQESALRLHELPEYISKEEALRRTVLRGRVDSTPPRVIASQRSQAPSPATPIVSRDDDFSIDLDRIGTAHMPAVAKTPRVRESPIRPPTTIHSPAAQRQRSVSVSAPKESPIHPPKRIHSQLSERQRSVSVSPTKVRKSKEKAVKKKGKNENSAFETAVNSIRNAVGNRFSALFSPLPMEWTPTVKSTTSLKDHNGTSDSQKNSKKQKNTHDNVPLLKGTPVIDWEKKSGKIRAYVTPEDGDDDTEIKENIAFSAKYIAKKRSVSISNTTFASLKLEVGKRLVLNECTDGKDNCNLSICSVAEGRVRVLLGGGEDGVEGTLFEIGKGGVWRVRVGERCEVCAVEGDREKERDGDDIAAVMFVVGVGVE